MNYIHEDYTMLLCQCNLFLISNLLQHQYNLLVCGHINCTKTSSIGHVFTVFVKKIRYIISLLTFIFCFK